MEEFDRESEYSEGPPPSTENIIERPCLVCGKMMASSRLHRVHQECRRRVSKMFHV